MTTEKNDTTCQTTSRCRTGHCFLFFFIVVALSTCSAYTLWLTKKNAHAIAHLSTITVKKSKHRDDLMVTLATMNEAHASLQNQLSSLAHKLQLEAQHPVVNNQLWNIAQAKYYLELLAISGALGNNVSGCQALLQQVHVLLKALNDPSLNPVLMAVRLAQQSLQTYPHASLLDTLSTLARIQTQLHAAFPADFQQPATPLSSSPQSTHAFISISRQPAHQPVTTHSALSTQIDLNLQIAKTALLEKNASLYQFAIQHAIEDASHLPSTVATTQQTLLHDLHVLEQTPAFMPFPPLDAPLQALIQWLDQQKINGILPAASTTATPPPPHS